MGKQGQRINTISSDAAANRPPLPNFNSALWVYSVVFGPNGKQLASAGDQTARIWDLQSGQNEKIFTLESATSAGQPGVRAAVSVVAYSPDGGKLAIASTLGTVHLVLPNTGAILHTLTPPSAAPPR